MKSKIFILCPVVLLFLFLGASCQKDEWEKVVLNDNSCSGVTGILDSFTDYSGTVRNMFPEIGTNTFCIMINDTETSTELRFIACNLPKQYHQTTATEICRLTTKRLTPTKGKLIVQ